MSAGSPSLFKGPGPINSPGFQSVTPSTAESAIATSGHPVAARSGDGLGPCIWPVRVMRKHHRPSVIGRSGLPGPCENQV